MPRGGKRPGAGRKAGRPKGPDKVRVEVQWTPDVVARLDDARGRLNRSDYLALLVELYGDPASLTPRERLALARATK